MTDPSQSPEQLDPDYDHHGGFPEYGAASPGPGFGRFVAAMRRLQDLAVSADPSDDVWNDAAEHAEALADQLAPFKAPEGQAPAGRSPQLPGMGSLLLPPWTMTRYDPDGVEMRGHFTRFHVGGNGAVHGGVLPLLFDHVFGMVVHAAARRALGDDDGGLAGLGRVHRVERPQQVVAPPDRVRDDLGQ